MKIPTYLSIDWIHTDSDHLEGIRKEAGLMTASIVDLEHKIETYLQSNDLKPKWKENTRKFLKLNSPEMKYLNNLKHALIGVAFVSILLGFVEYNNPVSALAYAVGFGGSAAIILSVIYGLVWILMPKSQKEKYKRKKSGK